MIFYYSGCGNSRWVAQALATRLGEQLLFIPDMQCQGLKEYTIREGEAVGFVFPVYAWGAPALVEQFVRSVAWRGEVGYVWFACTCGDEMGLTHRSFGSVLRSVGLTLSAAFCFVMPETYLCFPGFHLDSKEREAQKIAQAAAKLPSVVEQIRRREAVMDVHLGPLPRIKSWLIRPLFLWAVTDSRFRASEQCTSCGTCVRVCPLHNVQLAEGRPSWQGHCTQCMACYHHCPTGAIQFGSLTRGKGQYFFHEKGIEEV